jgi:hypothetical protein
MEEIPIAPLTASHKRKMVKGQPFRIKHGGAVMLVKPHRVPKIMKAFKNGKSHTISMTDEEVHANGGSIFGDRFDRFLNKHGVKKAVYAVGDQLKPIAKAGITAGILGGATALSGLETFATGGAGASLVPAIGVGALGLSALANDYIDNPKKYQGSKGQTQLNDLKSAGMSKVGAYGNQIGGQYGMSELGTNPYGTLNAITGTNAGALGTANGQVAIANSINQQLSNAQVFARDSLYTAPVMSGGLNAPSVLQSAQLQNPLRVNPLFGTPTPVSIQAPNTQSSPTQVASHYGKVFGTGLGTGIHNDHIMNGNGIHHIVKRHSQNHEIRGKGVKERHGKLVEMGSIGIQGNLTRTPQALNPAPYASNFVWSSTLPPAYRRFNTTPASPAPLF